MKITITPYDDVRWRPFKAHQGAKVHIWAFGRSAKCGLWFLRDSDGYIRTLESTWLASVPMIQLVLGNYDMIANVN